MPSTKDLKKRITSVKNTQQTTRAMKMVSAAKLRRAQEAIVNERPYAKRAGELIHQVLSIASGDEKATAGLSKSPLIRKEGEAGVGKKKVLLVLVSSDRGLCGGFNSSIIKAAQRWDQGNRDRYASVAFGFVGRKAYDYFKTRKSALGPYYSELGGKVSFEKAKKLVDSLIEHYLSGEADEVKFIYNEFKNAATQRVVVEDFLPLQPDAVEGAPAATAESVSYILKPSYRDVLEQLLDRHFAIQAFRVLLESQASEHGARMSAMENATKNAGEMIRKLTLQYNKQRQAGITKELLEIIAGSESQKDLH